MSSGLAATVLPLVGVVLGSAGTFSGQYLATRETKKQAKASAVAVGRAELKDEVLKFLEACQRVEQAAEDRFMNGNQFVEGSPQLTHEMWLRQKIIDLIATRRIRDTAYQFTDRLMGAAYGRVPDGVAVWDFVTEKREPFMDAVRDALVIVVDD